MRFFFLPAMAYVDEGQPRAGKLSNRKVVSPFTTISTDDVLYTDCVVWISTRHSSSTLHIKIHPGRQTSFLQLVNQLRN